MADDAIELVRLRNEFYRDSYRRVLAILLLAFLIVFILISALVYVITHPPAPKYFATDSTGRIVPLIPLDQPNLSTPALLQWANIAAVAAFTFDFVNYRQQLQAASEYFTPPGWEAYMQAVQSSNNLGAVIEKKLTVSAVATGAPVVLQQGILNGRYSWKVQIPLLVTYQSANQISQQNLVATLFIARVSTLNSAQGVGIAQFIAV
jgi:intracellular multiplication protein IcmL